MQRSSTIVFRLLAALVLTAGPACTAGEGGKAMGLELSSAEFAPGSDIPAKFTCEGPDASPSLSWGGLPDGTQSVCLIMDDPDAPVGTWVHWVLYDLPPGTRELPEGVPAEEQLSSGARQGRNDFGRIGYGGPCPPPGSPHRYFFKLYALDAPTGLEPGATKAELERAMQGHVLMQAELIGLYRR